jgi:hypothetical protein
VKSKKRTEAKLVTQSERFEEFPWVTFLVAVISLIVLVAGFVVVLSNDEYTFDMWTHSLVLLTIGLGLLGIGRGIRAGLMKQRMGS